MNDKRKHQLGHLVIYKEMQKIAKKNNIKLFAYYGTMLGIERHGGFIPWDDDIDVAVWNEEYDLFIRALQKELPKRFAVALRSRDWKQSAEEATIVDMESKVFANEDKTITRAYCVDLFRFGYLKKQYKNVPFRKNFWRGIQFVGNSGSRSYGAKIARQIIRHLLPGRYVHEKVDKIDSTISEKNPSQAYLSYDLSDGWRKGMDADVFRKYEVRKLEGIDIYMPVNPDPFLAANYGDWKIPEHWDKKAHYY